MFPDRHFDALIIGAGPAGLAAAWTAARGGGRVGLVDENHALGGQIWRHEAGRDDAQGAGGAWFEKVARSAVSFLSGVRVIAQTAPQALLTETPEGSQTLSYDRLILAPGARERFLPFPGWTLPNVLGAGGLQALVKSGLSVQNKRVVVAGSGPLLLAVAVYLRKKGALLSCVAEQAPGSSVVRFGLGLISSPPKLAQAGRMRLALRGVPYRTGCWPVFAKGTDRLESVSLSDGRIVWDEPCDYLACGFGLVPNTELPRALGCDVHCGSVVTDEWQQTTIENVYCAGEATGVGGLEKSLVEGQIAGYAAIGQREEARRLFPERAKSHAFASSLDRAFALRAELRELPRPETIVCRCEDVRFSRLAPFGSSRAAKLHTRCGMGPCQGRICGPAVEFLRQWPPDTVRPPIFPARLESLTRIN
jgi:NADPH-dependent 2,4-dienoyl-CoA reductase/sulfur reductase-like enzyme